MEVKDIVTIGISSAALAISLLTYYFNLLRKPKLRLVAGDALFLNYTHDGKVQLSTNLTVFNQGALPGALIRLIGTISTSSRDRETQFEWWVFTQSKNVGEPGKTLKRWVDFAGWVETIVVPGRSAVVKGIGFITDNKFDVTEGTYKISFVGYSGPDGRQLPIIEHSIDISSTNERFLREKCVANPEGVREHSLILRYRRSDGLSTSGLCCINQFV